MAKLFILVIISMLIILTGCSSSNNSSETAPQQFIFQQSDTPLELAVTPSILMLGQSANITVKTTANAFVEIRIVPPDQELLLKKLKYLGTTETADNKGIFTTYYSAMYRGSEQTRAVIPGYYRVIAASEARKALPESYSLLRLHEDDFIEMSHSGNVTIVITSFLVR